MKEVILKRIKLSNWKSLNLDVKFNDKSTKISAKNGVGKSSLIAGWNWLLSSYTNAVSPKNHELFDNREELTHETPIAGVKAWISIDDVDYTIEKTAQAKFTRKRGSNEWSKDSSDVYKVYIDEIE
jgi:AAA15 family ATPase/GTPase